MAAMHLIPSLRSLHPRDSGVCSVPVTSCPIDLGRCRGCRSARSISAFAETLQDFVRRQDAATLASVLLALTENHVAIRDRLVRLQWSNVPKRWQRDSGRR